MNLVELHEESMQRQRDYDMRRAQQQMIDRLENVIMEKLESIEARLDDHDRKLKKLRRAMGGV